MWSSMLRSKSISLLRKPSSVLLWQSTRSSISQQSSCMFFSNFTSDGLSPRQKRLLYRASQNGQLELDLMLGSWIQKRIPDLTSDKQLDDLEQIVGLENPDMISYMLGHEELPDELKNNELIAEIQEYTQKTKKHRFVEHSADGRLLRGNQTGNV